MNARRVVPLVILALLALDAGASAQSRSPCFAERSSCTSVPVELDRTGLVPGTVRLAAIREQTGPSPARSAVVALAGGPGQAAVPLIGTFKSVLKPMLAGRDLLVYDQRGTGESGPLDCAAASSPNVSELKTGQTCAASLGRMRGFYRTADSVQDLEDLRVSAGYDKLVLYGVSYGTKLAMDYASAHPDRVEALILDSVEPQTGSDPFLRPAIQAIPRMLDDLCRGDCARFTRSATHDLATLAGRLRRHRLTGKVLDARAHRRTARLSQRRLLEIIVGGDLDPDLRAAVPGLVRAALRGDTRPLLRVAYAGSHPRASLPDLGSLVVNPTLYLATTCEEQPMPWNRSTTSIAARRTQAATALAHVRAADVAPFDAAAAAAAEGTAGCLGWPVSSPPPLPPAPLPSVPTLVLEGRGDLRTPLEGAQRAVAGIPGASIVVIPRVGHSVMASDETGCARAALAAFAAGRPVPACHRISKERAPLPSPPARLAALHRAGGLPGRAGRTLEAVRLTIDDAATYWFADVGGLRGGIIKLIDFNAVRLRRDSYVPGVELTGTYTFDSRPSYLTVSGRAAAHGRLRISGSGTITGHLDGHKVKLSLAASAGRPSPWKPVPERDPLTQVP